MSIYPVILSEWFPPKDENHKIMRIMVEVSRCYSCKKKNMHWQTAYGHHSIPWGSGDIWCTKRCYSRKNNK